MMPPTTTGASTPSARSRREHLGDELEVAARQDRQADHVDVLVASRRGDLLGRQPDAGVHDLHAGVACRHGDLLGAIRVAVEPRLRHEEARRAARHRPHTIARGLACRRCDGRPPHPLPSGRGTRRRRRAASRAHSPVVTPAFAQAIVGGITFASDAAAAASSRSARRGIVGGAIAPPLATSAIISASTCRIDPQDALVALERRRRALGERVDARRRSARPTRCAGCARTATARGDP